MPHHQPLLQGILDQIRTYKKLGQPTLSVFDLDSTLFDVGPRLEKILFDFASQPAYQLQFPEQIKHFKNLKIERRDWGIRQTLIRAGLDGHHPEFQEALRNFWRATFFSNDYLKYDTPYPGAVNYVQALHRAGTEIAYLTGRDVHRMGEGSERILKHWQFPLGDRAQLILKPQKGMNDALFKKDWFGTLPARHYAKIWFFENEPVNIQLLQKVQSPVEIIFFDSTHSGQAQPPENIPSIMHFLLDPSEED